MERLTAKQKHILQQKLCDMKNRCNSPKNKFYKDYGARGIKVCDEWQDKKEGHANFQKWALENGWKEFLSIERIDVNGNYEPSNCRWATPKEQANNRRNNAYITIHGVTKTAQEWADQIGITERAFMNRVVYGWSEDRLLEPKNKPLKMTKAEMTKEIKYWRNLEEQGLLLRLPCKVGDEFFVIAYIDNKITHVRCSGYEISVDDISKKANFSIIWIDSVEKPRDYWRLTFEEFKNRCFTTQEEAEQALERMEKENGNVD